MQITDLASLLAYLLAGGAAYFLPDLLEKSARFHMLKSEGKILIVLSITIATTMGAGVCQEFFVSHPIISATVDSQLKLALVAINVVITQMKHGGNLIKEFKTRALANGSGK